ncbi:hypothetical protein STEG23_030965, partial [Scotinomys teguina]
KDEEEGYTEGEVGMISQRDFRHKATKPWATVPTQTTVSVHNGHVNGVLFLT